MKTTDILQWLWCMCCVGGNIMAMVFSADNFMFVVGMCIQSIGVGFTISNIIVSWNKEKN